MSRPSIPGEFRVVRELGTGPRRLYWVQECRIGPDNIPVWCACSGTTPSEREAHGWMRDRITFRDSADYEVVIRESIT